MADLLPCPFCGAECVVEGKHDCGRSVVRWVECGNCGYSSSRIDGDEGNPPVVAAIAAHDTTASLTTLGADVVKALRDALDMPDIGIDGQWKFFGEACRKAVTQHERRIKS